MTDVLVITAHPDDVDFGAAGTIATWTAAGLKVAYCIATHGDAGGREDTPREQMRDFPMQLAPIREQEQRAAAAEVGVHDVTFLDYLDGHLSVTYELRRDLAREIRRHRPDRVLTLSPERDWAHIRRSHPDHLAIGEAALCAVYPDARNPFACPELLHDEGLEPWAVPEVWMTGGPECTEYVDVTDTFDRKLAALRAHASQTDVTAEFEAMLRSFLTENAARGGLPEGRLAEAFRVISTR